MKASWIDTPLGVLLVVSDEEALVSLEFHETKTSIAYGKTKPIEQVEKELEAYFAGNFCEFKTPLRLIGSPFQKRVWEELRKIPRGETRSYAQIATLIEKPTACRAVGLANGANLFPVLIPCHRVINSNGDLGGYGGGVRRKEWLLQHERR